MPVIGLQINLTHCAGPVHGYPTKFTARIATKNQRNPNPMSVFPAFCPLALQKRKKKTRPH